MKHKKEPNLEEQKSEGNKVNNSHPMNQSPNSRMWPNEYPEKEVVIWLKVSELDSIIRKFK